jgi:hypothetical protein
MLVPHGAVGHPGVEQHHNLPRTGFGVRDHQEYPNPAFVGLGQNGGSLYVGELTGRAFRVTP